MLFLLKSDPSLPENTLQKKEAVKTSFFMCIPFYPVFTPGSKTLIYRAYILFHLRRFPSYFVLINSRLNIINEW